MSVLNSIAALVRPGDNIKLVLSTTTAGVLQCTVVPQLSNVDCEDADQTRRDLMAALATPFQFSVPGNGDVTAELTAVIQRLREPRASALDALTRYETALADATARARTATTAKAKAGKDAPAPALTADPVTESQSAAADAPATEVAGTPASGLFADCWATPALS